MLRLGHLTAVASVLLLRLPGTLADSTIQFLYPVDTGLTYYYLDRIDVSYDSNYSAPYLYTWCDLDGSATEAQSDRPDGYNATTEITLQFTTDVNDLDCWFNLRDIDLASSGAAGTNSKHWTYVNTTRDGGPVGDTHAPFSSMRCNADHVTVKQSTMGLPTATGTTGTPVSTPTTSSLTTATVTASAEASSSGLSTGAKAGIGIGVGIGVIAHAAMAGAFFFRRRRRTSREGIDSENVEGRTSPPLEFQGMAELEEQQGPAELGNVVPSTAEFKGKYAPVAPESPQELPADYPSSGIAHHELPAAVDRQDWEDQPKS